MGTPADVQSDLLVSKYMSVVGVAVGVLVGIRECAVCIGLASPVVVAMQN